MLTMDIPACYPNYWHGGCGARYRARQPVVTGSSAGTILHRSNCGFGRNCDASYLLSGLGLVSATRRSSKGGPPDSRAGNRKYSRFQSWVGIVSYHAGSVECHHQLPTSSNKDSRQGTNRIPSSTRSETLLSKRSKCARRLRNEKILPGQRYQHG
jgi:hypothetical protein